MSKSSTAWVPWRFVFEITKSGGEVNWLIDGLCGEHCQSSNVDLWPSRHLRMKALWRVPMSLGVVARSCRYNRRSPPRAGARARAPAGSRTSLHRSPSQTASIAFSNPAAPSTMRNCGRCGPRLIRSSRTVRQDSTLSSSNQSSERYTAVSATGCEESDESDS